MDSPVIVTQLEGRVSTTAGQQSSAVGIGEGTWLFWFNCGGGAGCTQATMTFCTPVFPCSFGLPAHTAMVNSTFPLSYALATTV